MEMQTSVLNIYVKHIALRAGNQGKYQLEKGTNCFLRAQTFRPFSFLFKDTFLTKRESVHVFEGTAKEGVKRFAFVFIANASDPF